MKGQIELEITKEDYVEKAIHEIQCMSINYNLCVRFSGGKDSIAVKRLMELAGVECQYIFSRTSVDPPELLSFIKKYHQDVKIELPRTSMYKMIIKKGFPPTRVCRYCCQEFKERNVCPKNNRVFTVTGVRKQESEKRRNRNKYETCQADKGVTFFHPIIDWTEDQVWNFIINENLPYASLYDKGFKRIGCVGCPLASSKQIKREFEYWPNFEKAYLWAFDKMLEGRNFDKWKTKYDVMEWYIFGVQKKYEQLEGQYDLFHGDYYTQFQLNEFDDIITPEFAREILLEGA